MHTCDPQENTVTRQELFYILKSFWKRQLENKVTLSQKSDMQEIKALQREEWSNNDAI